MAPRDQYPVNELMYLDLSLSFQKRHRPWHRVIPGVSQA